jgi:anti-anti-sigma regulatory factor
MTVEWTVTGDDRRLLVTLSGCLHLADVVGVRGRLLKCLAEQPEALLLDLSGLDVAEPSAPSVFASVRRQAARWPGIPLLLCAPAPRMREALTAAAYRSMTVFPTLAAARAGTRRRAPPALTEELLPIAGAARQARDVATDACLRWDLPELVAPASLIASELVSNVVEHAGTMMNLRLAVRDRRLHVAVSDGSSVRPVPSAAVAGAVRGHGLSIVQAIADSWGWLPTEGGKVVWAVLRTEPRAIGPPAERAGP